MESNKELDLGIFDHLKGSTWENKTFPHALKGDEGSPQNPFSYNVMPLPQPGKTSSGVPDNGYILKNFRYYEMLKFNGDGDGDIAHPALAPNRGGEIEQLANALFYDQNVLFAEGPGKDTAVHVENGLWLNLKTDSQFKGPYDKHGKVNEDATVIKQPKEIAIAKQMSIPHGNSILALGKHTESQLGSPNIPNAPSPIPAAVDGTPHKLDTGRYVNKLDEMENFQNPHPDYTANANLPIQNALPLIRPNHYIEWEVSTEAKVVKYETGSEIKAEGSVLNVPFEKLRSEVTEYTAKYWLLSTSDVNDTPSYDFLLYTQNIVMVMQVNGREYYFPHTTANALTRV